MTKHFSGNMWETIGQACAVIKLNIIDYLNKYNEISYLKKSQQ